MMTHIVLFRKRLDVDANPTLEKELVAWMHRLNGEIDFIRGWKVNANELDRPICWDYVLEATFDDKAALARYLPHPAHVALITALKSYFEWVACDYSSAA